MTVARSGLTVDEVLQAPGLPEGEVYDRLLSAMAADGDYQAVRVSPDRFHFARTFRPMWAIVTACITVWLVLIGFVFLFIKTTETCLAVIESDHRGVRVRLQGKVSAAALGRLRAALAGETAFGSVPSVPQPKETPGSSIAAVAPARPVGAPVASMSPAVEQRGQVAAGPASSQARISDPQTWVAAAEPAAVHNRAQQEHGAQRDHEDDRTVVSRSDGTGGLAAPARPHAVIDDGSVIELAAVTLIGRDPAATEGEQALLVPVDDSTRSVSKTHLAIMWQGGRWTVVDRNSTNGVCIVGADHATVSLTPGVPAPVFDGSVVHFGDRTLRMVAW